MQREATSNHSLFDRALLARRRARFAASALNHDFLLRHVAEDFAHRLSFVRRKFETAVNLGAYHGIVSRRLRAQGIGHVVDLDPTPQLLAQCDGPHVLAEEEWLPLGPACVDLVVSGLALHLVNDLPGALVQIRRALKPDGLLLAALLGPQTLQELREAFVLAETELQGGAGPRVAPFADVRAVGSLLQRAGLALPVTDTEVLTVGYASPLHLVQELRAMGAANMLTERPRKPLRRQTLQRAVELYQQRHGRPDGRVRATFEIVTATAWAPHESQQRPLQPGSAQVRLADALRDPRLKK